MTKKRDTIYDDHTFPKTPIKQFTYDGYHSHQQAADNKLSYTQDALLALTDAHFEDRNQTNYQNIKIGKHNKVGGMRGQGGGLNGVSGTAKRGQVHNNDTVDLTRITEGKKGPHGENLFRPYRTGTLMPERGQKGRYQYKDAWSVKITKVVDATGARVTKSVSTISSSAYGWNSEIKFNKYVSHDPPSQEGDNLQSPIGDGESSAGFTDVTYSSSATVMAFSAYDGLFGASSNYSSTANASQSLNPSQMSSVQTPVISTPITGY